MLARHSGSAWLVLVAVAACGGSAVVQGGTGGTASTSSSSVPAGGAGAAGGPVHEGGSLPAGDECLVVVTMTQGHVDPNDPCGLCITWANSACEAVSDVTNTTGPCGPANQCVGLHCRCVPLECTVATCHCIDDCLWTAPSSCVDNYVAYFGCLKDECMEICEAG